MPLDQALNATLSRLTGSSHGRKSVGSFSDAQKQQRVEFPVGEENYELLEDCGRGVSATVHRAICKPLNQVCAVKRMNLESLNCDLDEIIHEAQTMKNYHHPNVLPLHCSFVTGQDLWMVMPYISGGSVLHIMKYAYPEGLDEASIATIMRDVLRALDYVHKQGGIHRDVKAGNILIDRDGHVHLGDFGVAASLERGGSWGHSKAARMTFVGTPCWMAPEVMEQTQGYDNSADIWSVGITLLEMAHGHAPFAKFPPMKVLLMTLQNPPPTLDDKGKKHFSKSMRDLVSKCLQKDPRNRPTAAQLLEHKFFKIAKDDEFLAKNLMAGLPPLTARVQEIRQGKAATNAYDNDKNLALSQEEYKKGVSSWNFNVAALKQQAANESNDPPLPTITENEELKDPTMHKRENKDLAAQQQQQQLEQQQLQHLQQLQLLGAHPQAPLPVTQPLEGPAGVVGPQGGWLLPQATPATHQHAQLPHLNVLPETSGNISLQGAVMAAQQADGSVQSVVQAPDGSIQVVSPQSVVHAPDGSLQVVNPSQGVVLAQPDGVHTVVHPGEKYDSVFASLQGQQQLLASTSQATIPVPVHPSLESPDGNSQHGGPLDHDSKLVTGVDVLVSPSAGQVSPPPLLSNENSGTVGAPTPGAAGQPLGSAGTPNAAKQKIKQQGRFQVYEPGSDPPPMSPSNGSTMLVVPLAAFTPAASTTTTTAATTTTLLDTAGAAAQHPEGVPTAAAAPGQISVLMPGGGAAALPGSATAMPAGGALPAAGLPAGSIPPGAAAAGGSIHGGAAAAPAAAAAVPAAAGAVPGAMPGGLAAAAALPQGGGLAPGVAGPLAEQPLVQVRGDKLAQLEVGDTVFDENAAMEPKKKGRFLVMEQQASSLQKSSSAVSLGDARHHHHHHHHHHHASPAHTGAAANATPSNARLSGSIVPPPLPPPGGEGVGTAPGSSSAAGGGAAAPHGKPPTAPTSAPSVTAVLPKLQELVEHSAQHQAALLKLMAAVADTEKGKPTPLFSRTSTNRSLFADMSQLPYPPSSSTTTPYAGASPSTHTAAASPRAQSNAISDSHAIELAPSLAEDQRALNDQLHRRLLALEAENSRLRARNQQLEAAQASASGSTHQQHPYQRQSLPGHDLRRIGSPPAGGQHYQLQPLDPPTGSGSPAPGSHSRPGASPGPSLNSSHSNGSGGRASPALSPQAFPPSSYHHREPSLWDDAAASPAGEPGTPSTKQAPPGAAGNGGGLPERGGRASGGGRPPSWGGPEFDARGEALSTPSAKQQGGTVGGGGAGGAGGVGSGTSSGNGGAPGGGGSSGVGA